MYPSDKRPFRHLATGGTPCTKSGLLASTRMDWTTEAPHDSYWGYHNIGHQRILPNPVEAMKKYIRHRACPHGSKLR